jgi:hypothetical protein
VDDDEKRKADARRARKSRRKRRRERDELVASAAVTRPNVTPLFPMVPRNALEVHTAQLSAYLLEMHASKTISLESKLMHVCRALPAFARATEASDLAKRISDIEHLFEERDRHVAATLRKLESRLKTVVMDRDALPDPARTIQKLESIFADVHVDLVT